jgi:hypothetical protein
MPRAPYHGGKSVIYGSPDGTGVAVVMISLSSWTLDKATDTVEVTAFGDDNKVYVQGLPDIKGTISGYFDSGADALFDAADSADGIKLYLYPSSLCPTVYHYGPAWVSASIATDVKGAVSVSGSFVANGSWGRKPA